MVTITRYPTLRSPAIVVPLTTALFGFLGLGTGLYSYLSPGVGPAKAFGILPPTNVDTNSESDARQRAYIQIHGIRNVAVGLTNLGLLAFWRFSSTCQSSPSAAVALQKAIAIGFAVGSLVGFGDGLILGKFVQSGGLSKEAEELARGQGTGHMVLAVPILALGAGWWYL